MPLQKKSVNDYTYVPTTTVANQLMICQMMNDSLKHNLNANADPEY